MYRQPPPPPDLLPVVVSASAESVPETGLPVVVPAVLRPHGVTVHTAHMTLFVQSHVQPCSGVQLWEASMAAQTMVQQQGGG